jgi:pilus assembly protein Flp/PilA
MLQFVKDFWNEEEGATAVEYGIMVAAIAAVIITVVISIGSQLNATFSSVDSAMTPTP